MVSDPLRGCRCFRVCNRVTAPNNSSLVSDPLRGCRCFRGNYLPSLSSASFARFRPLAGMSVFPGPLGSVPSYPGTCVSDPLRGCRCFRGVRDCRWIRPTAQFQTPCGDVGVSGTVPDRLSASTYHVSDPLRGCRCFRVNTRRTIDASTLMFQTPCGDVGVSGRFPRRLRTLDRTMGFRPLAGMSVFPGQRVDVVPVHRRV